MSNTPSFDSSNVVILLSDIAKIRADPGVFIGSTHIKGIHKMVYEAVDNGVDESKELVSNRQVQINLTLKESKEVVVVDNGRGIPTSVHPTTKMPTVISVFEHLSAGSKLSVIKDKKTATAGAHGMGMTATNALSEYMIIHTHRGEQVAKVVWHQGIRQSDMELLTKADLAGHSEEMAVLLSHPSGSMVQFKPDETMMEFSSTTGTDGIFYDINEMRSSLKSYMLFNKNVRFIFKYWDSERGEYVTETFNQEEYSLGATIAAEGNAYAQLRVAANNCSIDYDLNICKYGTQLSGVNGLKMRGGTHIQGFNTVLLNMVLDAMKDIVVPEIPLGIQDIASNISYAISVEIIGPVFNGQAKENLESIEPYQLQTSRLMAQIKGNAREWFQALVEAVRYEYLQKVEFQRSLSRKEAIKLSKSEIRMGMAEFLDCRGTGGNSILVLCEGQSAMNPFKHARDVDCHALFDIQGKIKNLVRAEVFKRLRFVFSLIESDKYNIILLVTDADVDGKHIRALVMAAIMRRYPHLVEQGRFLVAEMPLYRVQYAHGTEYAINDEELEAMRINNPAIKEVKRFKGIGGMTPDELRLYLDDGVAIQPYIDEECDVMIEEYLGKATLERTRTVLDIVGTDRLQALYHSHKRADYTTSGRIFEEIDLFNSNPDNILLGEYADAMGDSDY